MYTFANGDANMPGITATGQLYSRNGDFVGIVGVDYYLSAIESFLTSTFNSSTVYITDKSGAVHVHERASVALVPANAICLTSLSTTTQVT